MMTSLLTVCHTIELIGSHVARHVESGLTIDLTSRRNRSTTKGPISPICRKMLEDGHSPTDRVHIIRKSLDHDGLIPVFKRDRSLKAWADTDCVESETKSVRVVKYCPFPDTVKANHARGATRGRVAPAEGESRSLASSC